MPKRILATDQDQTPDDDILGGRIGTVNFKCYCTAYASDPATFQMRIEKEWITVNFNKTDIELTKKGAVLDVTLRIRCRLQALSRQIQGQRSLSVGSDPHR